LGNERTPSISKIRECCSRSARTFPRPYRRLRHRPISARGRGSEGKTSSEIFSVPRKEFLYFFSRFCRIVRRQNCKVAIGLLSQFMRVQIRGPRFPLVALVAIAMILWGVPVVTACTAEKAATSACCCAAQTSADCGCCSKAEHRLERTPPSPERAPGTSFTGARVPCATCVCGQPTSPARQSQHSDSQTNEESTSEAVPGFLHISHSDCASFAPRPFAQIGLLPTRTPLYLRVERLII
jgi:hypothetical protein